MKENKSLFEYSKKEEFLNIYTHGFGFIFSIVGLILLLIKPVKEPIYFWSILVFGISLCVLYFSSTFYHNAKEPIQRRRLKIVDHCAIYVLIAGTYTPFTLIILPSEIGMLLFLITWLIAITGIILKLFFTGRFDIISTLLYIAMGWLIIFAYQPLLKNLPQQGVYWLFAGGLFYTIGAVLYSIKKIPYNHAIFHVFVLLGSFCHYWSVYFYV